MSGTMRERPANSKRWELRAYAGRDPETGNPRQVSRIFRGGKREARKALDKLVGEVDAGQHVGTTATFGKLLDLWLAKVEDLGKARTTLETYRQHVEKYIRPSLGDVRLDKLDTYRLDQYFQGLRTKGLAAGTVKLDHSVVSACLSLGVDYGWIKGNAAKRVRLREAEPSNAVVLGIDQLRMLYFGIEKDGEHVKGALEDDPDIAVTIALAALTGCRRGELCGLQWSDVDWVRQCVKVERAWVPGEGGQHLTTTKTGKGRTVYLGTAGTAILEGYRESKRELLGRDPEGWLLSYDGGATPMRAKSLTAYITKLGKRVGVPVHFHQFRHLAASELNHAGVDLPTAAAQLGHSPAVMAGTYLHSSDDRGAKAGELISAVVGRALGAPMENQARAEAESLESGLMPLPSS
jgi:integrase